MMLTACLSPRAFAVPEGSSANAHCSLVIAFLRDLQDNGVVLEDEQAAPGETDKKSITHSAIREAIDTWPQQYRSKVKTLFNALRVHNRFVKIPKAPSAATCENRPCQYAIGIAGSRQADALLVSDDCKNSVKKALQKTEVFTAESYALSDFNERLKKCMEQRISSGELTQSQAEQRIFGPLLRYAKHLKIIDRYIGRSVPARESGSARLGEDYKRSLEWICSIFRDKSERWSSGSRVEIFSGIDVQKISPNDLQASIQALREWEQEMIKKGYGGLKLYLFEENHKNEMPHARYLLTDQIGILVDRGFDLLLSANQMRTKGSSKASNERQLKDCAFAVIREAGQIEAEVRKLPALNGPNAASR